MTSVIIPNSVTSIGDNTFWNCTSLTSVTIGKSVTDIDEYVFYNCAELSSIVVEGGNTKYDSRDNCNALIETSTNTLILGCKNTIIPNSVTSIGESAFEKRIGLISVNIPNSVSNIEKRAFYNCSGLISITIPNSVTTIGRSAFSKCTSLTSITIPNSVTSIDYGTFLDCIGLTSVTIENSSISESAFQNCTSLTSITIGNSVATIGNYAFYNCSGLTSIVSKNPVPPTCGSDVFYEVNTETTTLMVPDESLSLYQSADTWKNFLNIIDGNMTGVEETLVDETEVPVEYYKLNGVKVENPGKGIYIKRQGTRTSKVVLQ